MSTLSVVAGGITLACLSIGLGGGALAVGQSRLSTIEAVTEPWRAYAQPVPPRDNRARIAVVLDDLGPNLAAIRRAVALDRPLTLAFLPHTRELADLVAEGRGAGHEIILHMPMQAAGDTAAPGAGVLTLDLPEDEFLARFDRALDAVPDIVGVNNHMGSVLTADRPAMARVMAVLKARGLLFLDSRTTPETVAFDLAREAGLPRAARDIFLDNQPTLDHIRGQLEKLEHMAERRGQAIAIGHPNAATLDALESWIPDAAARGFQFVPISAVVVVSHPRTPDADTLSAR